MPVSFSEQRTPEQVAYDKLVLERVENGIRMLEQEHGPDWVEKIDLSALDLDDGSACILGQLYQEKADGFYSGYSWAFENLPTIKSNEKKAVFFGFTTDEHLEGIEAWEGVIFEDEDGFEDEENSWTRLQAAWEHKIVQLRNLQS